MLSNHGIRIALDMCGHSEGREGEGGSHPIHHGTRIALEMYNYGERCSGEGDSRPNHGIRTALEMRSRREVFGRGRLTAYSAIEPGPH